MEKKTRQISIPETLVTSKIYIIRNKKIMLDRDLAELYEVETRALNQAVNRNIERFPEEFMFQLTTEEFEILKSQIVTSSWGGTRKMPFAFTELCKTLHNSVYGIIKKYMNLSGIIYDERRHGPLSILRGCLKSR